MPITINGSGTVTGISAGGLPDGCVTGDDIANSTIPAAKLGTTEQSRLCRAWVNFDGTGTVAIRASYNVSSITDNGVGDYTVNFTTAMADANYSAVCSAHSVGFNRQSNAFAKQGGYNTGNVNIWTGNTVNAAAEDLDTVNVAIFR